MSRPASVPDCTIDCEAVFGFELPWEVRAFSKREQHVPHRDDAFQFASDVTKAILMGFAHNRRVYVHGPHGSGKTSHIEQVAARLNWPCIRINLDGHITRADLIGRDMIVLREGKQVTEFVPGMLVWALERPVALIFDEYDAGRPDVMFVIQRLLESQGSLTLLDQNRVITPHPAFRILSTANTAGQGDSTGMYVGTQSLNQAQMDRWHVVAELSYLKHEEEVNILCSRSPALLTSHAEKMVNLACLCRQAYRQGDLSSLMSLRTLINWAENMALVHDSAEALRLAFYNRCDDIERPLLAEFYQRCFSEELAVAGDERHLF